MSKVDLMRESEKRLKNKVGRKYKRDTKLQELEKQLEFAESRCGTLKQQLDYIKRMYGCARSTNIERQPSREEGHGDGSNIRQFSYSDISKWKKQSGILANREDGDGPELIENSVSHSNTTSTNSNSKPPAPERHEVKKKYSTKAKAHFKLLKVKKKNCKKIKKRRKSTDGGSSKVSNASSQTHTKLWQDPVVEIYKNSAVNVESESGFDIINRNKVNNKSNEILSEVLRQKINDRLKGAKKQDETDDDESKSRSSNNIRTKMTVNIVKEEGIQTETSLDMNQLFNQKKRNDLIDYLNKENAIKIENICADNAKSYCQPTISSKRKQVERDIYSNLTNIRIRNIPFIAAKSTAPSHNIGVNIQQVLSIMKKRQPKSEYLLNDYETHDNPALSLTSSRKIGINQPEAASLAGITATSSSESRKRSDVQRTSLSHWKSNADINRERIAITDDKCNEERNNNNSNNWSFKVDKLKKVLVFLHEDFSSLSQKYRRLQKKLTKRNITKTDAKDELAEIERELEKKEEEITVVIALYKEVLNLREDFKKLQEKYNTVTSGRTFTIDGLRQSNSTHIQMTALLRKIQNFQDKLKG